MSYEEMTALEFTDKLTKILNKLGRFDCFCDGVDCVECGRTLSKACIQENLLCEPKEVIKLVYDFNLNSLSKKEFTLKDLIL